MIIPGYNIYSRYEIRRNNLTIPLPFYHTVNIYGHYYMIHNSD